jgi:hypothetical protein
MKELLRSNDPVFLSWLVAVLEADRIPAFVLDTHTSIMEGSVIAIERRVMVAEEDHSRARRLVDSARPGPADEPPQ